MAFTVKGEYERLLKYKEKSKDGKLPFECGVACGYVTRIEYVPSTWFCGERIDIFAIAGFDNFEKPVLSIRENDVKKRYQDRRYKYWKEFNVLEVFER